MPCQCESSLCDHDGACPRPVDPRIRMQYVEHTCTQCAANMAATGGGGYLTLTDQCERKAIDRELLDVGEANRAALRERFEPA